MHAGGQAQKGLADAALYKREGVFQIETFLYETGDKIQETRGRSACGAHFSPALLVSLVSLFIAGFRPMWVYTESSEAAGSTIIKQAPWPFLLSTATCPSCFWMMP